MKGKATKQFIFTVLSSFFVILPLFFCYPERAFRRSEGSPVVIIVELPKAGLEQMDKEILRSVLLRSEWQQGGVCFTPTMTPPAPYSVILREPLGEAKDLP